MTNLNEFFTAFFSDERETLNLRLFKAKDDDDKPENGKRKLATSVFDVRTNAALQSDLKLLNKTRGVYFVVNAGGDSDKDITRYNAFFVENDNLTIAEQHANLDACPLQPSIRIETRKSVHAYFLIETDEQNNVNETTFRDVQTRLVNYFDGDKACVNPSRVMRVPYFNHVHFDRDAGNYEYKKVTIHTFDDSRRFTVSQMQTAFSAPKVNSSTTEHQQTERQHKRDFEFFEDRHAELVSRVLSKAKQNGNGNFDTRALCHSGKNETGLFYNPNEPELFKQIICNKKPFPCDYKAKLRGFGLSDENLPFRDKRRTNDNGADNQSSQQTPEKPQTQAQRLIALTDALDFFHTENRETYAVVAQLNGVVENVKINSKDFKIWLSRQFWNVERQTPSNDALQSAIENLRGKALYESKLKKTFIRIAETPNGKTYVDLVDAARNIVEVDENGFRIIESRNCPVRFVRKKGMLPLPTPETGGTIDELKNFANVADDDFILLVSWLVACFRNDKPFPILALHGEQGSAKSTTSRFVRELIDPNACALRSKPKDEHNLMVAANNSFIVAFDNLSYISADLSDALCRLATGGGFATRELYSDDDETLFNATRPILLNGIEELASRPDLIERALIFNCPRIEKGKRQLERKLKADFAKAKPKVFGALLELVATAKRNLPNLPEMEFPRMADFAEFAFAALGEDFNLRYAANRETANESALDASPIAKEILKFMETRTEWTGTPSELFFHVLSIADEQTRKLKTFPKQANVFSNQLTRIAVTLRNENINIERGRTGAKKAITITKLPTRPDNIEKTPSHIVTSSQANNDGLKSVTMVENTPSQASSHIAADSSGAESVTMRSGGMTMYKKTPSPVSTNGNRRYDDVTMYDDEITDLPDVNRLTDTELAEPPQKINRPNTKAVPTNGANNHPNPKLFETSEPEKRAARFAQDAPLICAECSKDAETCDCVVPF